MGGLERISGVARGCAHAACLVLTAWSLVATSAPDVPPVPAKDCFTGVPAAVALRVDLAQGADAGAMPDGGGDDASADAADDAGGEAGSPDGACYRDPSSPYAPCAPSCNGIDGIAAGATLVFDVDQGERPQVYGPHCFGYMTLGLRGVSGVTLGLPSAATDGAFASAAGPFVSPTEQGCRGDWGLELQPKDPVQPPDAGQLVSPLDAGVASPWVVVRSLRIPQAQFCGDAFSARGPVVCGDIFPVGSITEVSGP